MRSSTPFDAFAQGSCRPSFPYVALAMRLALGFLFFMAGWSKLTAQGGWSAAGYLANATGPFASWFQSLAGNGLVDQLNMWGLALIGVALIFGLGVHRRGRPSTFCDTLVVTSNDGLVDSFVANTKRRTRHCAVGR